MHKWLCSVMACLGLCAAGCKDPGCIRNSECKSGYSCKDNQCVAPDAGAADGGTKTGEGGASGKAGSSGKGGASAGKSGGSAGKSGSSAGQSGSGTPDAGTP